MDHGEAVQMMAVERYLLDELTPEDKDAFEQHLFGCSECALDLRAGAAFVSEARSQLLALDSQPAPAPAVQAISTGRPKKNWMFLFRPAFAAPAFAAMLTVIAWQNLSTIPSLRNTATEPRLLPSNVIHAGTRGSSHASIEASRSAGFALAIELPTSSTYSSYSFELHDLAGKQVWSRNTSIPSSTGDWDNAVSLMVPAEKLTQGSYSLSIFGITPQNSRVEIDRRVLDIQMDN
jgi:hypothetical protein